MRKTSKFIWLLLLFSVIVLGLVSCKSPDNTSDGKDPVEIDNEVIFSPYVDTTLVLGSGVATNDVRAVINEYYKITGKEISVKSASAEQAAHEIVIGKTDREISEKAYRYLLLSNNDEEKIGYIIYSDGKNVAIAFDEAAFGENIAFTEAIDCFVSKYMKTSSLKLNSGIVKVDNFFPIDKQEERDGQTMDKLWELKQSQIASKVYDDEAFAASVVEKLQSMYAMYNKDHATVTWLANLYDPVTGGFYYSNSARNNEGFASDLGSTSEALYLTELILGGYGGTLTDFFGEEIANKFVLYAKNMQSANGYFYHPQWSRELTDKTPKRKEIDVINALNILEAFGASPVYDTPNGVKGEGVSPVSRLSHPLSTDKKAAVLKLVSDESDEIYIPSYLKSEEAFNSYLATLNILDNTEHVIKTLNSELQLYITVDEILKESGESYSLCELLMKYLEKNQRYTGLWSASLSPTYKEIGNVIEVIKIFNRLEMYVPRFNDIIQTILDAMEFGEEPESISDISALWTALDYVVNNIKIYSNSGIEKRVNQEIDFVYSRYEKLLATTNEKMSLFTMVDGSFSMSPEGNDSRMYGMSVALPLTKEGDVYSTLIAAKEIWLSVFSVLGIGDVPIFNTSDRMMYQKTLLDMGVIIKNEVIKTPPQDFESYEINGAVDIRQVLTASNSYSKVTAGTEDHGNVLHLYSSANAATDEFYFKPQTTVRSASCYSYEMDIRVLSEVPEGFVAYLFLFRYMNLISFERTGDEIRLIERTSAFDENGYYTDLGVRAKIGEWFNLRVEYYLGTRETVRIKIFFNGNCIAVTDNFNGKQSATGSPSAGFEGFAFMSLRNIVMSLEIDNYVCESSYKTYTPETSKELILNIDTPDKKQVIHDFDSLNEGTTPGNFKPDDASAVKVKLDSDGNNVLEITEKAGEIILPIDQRGTAPNSAVVEFDIIVGHDSVPGAKYQINFNEYLYKERTLGAVQLTVVEEGGQKYITVSEVTTSGKLGTTYSNTKLSLGVKYNLRLQLFCKEKAMIISVDGVIIGINANILANAEKYNLYETTINSLTPSKKSTILIDNLVSEKTADDYLKATNPEEPRVEYTFDNTDGMDISGIEPTNGVLSFNDLQSGEANIIFPLTKRAIKPTLSVFKFDVIKNEKTYGQVIVKLTDKAGHIAAALAIVRSGDGISVHEYTENGAYPTPMYTSADDFSLIVKYSDEIGGYNLLVNDEYVTSSSLTYTRTSGEYKFESLCIEAFGPAGIALDNLYAEKVSDYLTSGLITHQYTSKEADKITFEQHSFAQMPKPFYLSTGNNQDSALTVTEDRTIGGEISKVIEFYAAAKNDTLNMEQIHKNPSEYNAAFFETDMKIVSTGGETGLIVYLNGYVDGQYVRVCDILLTASAPGAPLKLTGNDFESDLTVKEGEWFNLRYEYTDAIYDYDYDGKNDCVIRVYINGVLAGEGHKQNSTSPVSQYSGIYRAAFLAQTEGYVYVDNIILGQCNIEYDAPPSADTDTLTFNPGVVTSQTPFTFGKTTSKASVIDMANATEAANKVLQFYTSLDSEDKMSVIVTQTAQPEENANAVMFETEIMINPETDVATFYLSPQNNKSKYPFRLKIEAIKGGEVTISSAENGIPETVIGNSGEWIKLKVEYMTPMLDYTGDGVFDILCKIYADDFETPAVIGYKAYNTSSYYNPLELTKYVFDTTAETEAKIYFDNMKFWQVTLTPDEAPEGGGAESGSMGGSEDTRLDNDGWV